VIQTFILVAISTACFIKLGEKEDATFALFLGIFVIIGSIVLLLN
jgi:heme/copper-type cytochrome/quinol oxidase subunit 4